VGRHGYSDSCDDNWALLRWRGQVVSAIRGKRGQAFLRELIDALDAMPVKRLIPGALRKDGEVCAMGAIGAKRGVNLEALDPDDYEGIANTFGIAHQLVQEIEYENDADWRWDKETPEERWARVREWAVNQLKTESQR
jgi:hypothetical protein